MNAPLTPEELRLRRPSQWQVIFFACVILVLGVAVWQITARFEIIYRDFRLEGTSYNAAFRIFATPATLAVAIVVALAAVTASRKLSLPALGWLSFALAAGTIIFFAAFVAFFIIAFRFLAVSVNQ